MTGRELVTRLWKLFDAGEFEKALPLLHPAFTAEWPQSRERMTSPAAFIAVNRNYPGRWRCHLRRVVEAGTETVTEVEVTDGRTVVHAVSFFEFEDDKIIRLREFWADPFEAPAWRSQWITKY
jgi:ketosteroid isomerase-like protein